LVSRVHKATTEIYTGTHSLICCSVYYQKVTNPRCMDFTWRLPFTRSTLTWSTCHEINSH